MSGTNNIDVVENNTTVQSNSTASLEDYKSNSYPTMSLIYHISHTNYEINYFPKET